MTVAMKTPLLILDLDETLLWATETAPASGFDFRAFQYFVIRRPHLDVFLHEAFSWFEVAVWTSSGEDYARRVVNEIFDDPSTLEFVWTASRCTQRIDDETRKAYALKDLKKVRRRGYALERVLMIDDSPEKLRRQYGNHLRLEPFEGDPNHSELLDVLPFLEWLKDQENFRRVEKQSWRDWRRPR